MFKATRPDGGYIFHGGCDGCTNPIRMCPGCMYMEPNWNLPDLNPIHAEQKKEKAVMIKRAKLAAKNYNKPFRLFAKKDGNN